MINQNDIRILDLHDSIFFYLVVISIGVLWILICIFLDVKAKGFPKPMAYLNSLYNPFVAFLQFLSLASLLLLLHVIMGVYFYSPILCESSGETINITEAELPIVTNTPNVEESSNTAVSQGSYHINKVPKTLRNLLISYNKVTGLIPYSKSTVISQIIFDEDLTWNELRGAMSRAELLGLPHTDPLYLQPRAASLILLHYGTQPNDIHWFNYCSSKLVDIDLHLTSLERRLFEDQVYSYNSNSKIKYCK